MDSDACFCKLVISASVAFLLLCCGHFIYQVKPVDTLDVHAQIELFKAKLMLDVRGKSTNANDRPLVQQKDGHKTK